MPDNRSRDELLARVASLYYDKNLHQREIAKEIGLTRSAVSRLLSEAQKRGIVEFIVHYPWRTSTELENALRSNFDLKHIQVLMRENKDNEEMLQGLGVLAAQYFTQLLPTLKIVGITWGTGLHQMVRAMRPENHPNMEIIQLVGGTGFEASSIIGPLLAPNLANILGCRCRFLHAPLFMQSAEARQILMNDPTIRETVRRAEQCDLALVGIGTTLPELYNIYKTGYVTLQEVERMRADGIIGDVAGYHYNICGEFLMDHWVNQRIVAIPPSSMKKVKEVVAVAGGYRKGESIFAALRGRHINTLITDDVAAKRVLELKDQFGLQD